jgi:hypothetical protein
VISHDLYCITTCVVCRYKHELTGAVLRVQTDFVVGYSVYSRADTFKYTLTTCRTHKVDVGFSVPRAEGKRSLATAELSVPGHIAANVCYKL